eukprot:scaffold48_cov311-Pinguiococcus_pyrenoidosus.AAC.172
MDGSPGCLRTLALSGTKSPWSRVLARPTTFESCTNEMCSSASSGTSTSPPDDERGSASCPTCSSSTRPQSASSLRTVCASEPAPRTLICTARGLPHTSKSRRTLQRSTFWSGIPCKGRARV